MPFSEIKKNNTLSTDVFISGAGLVGSFLGLQLAQSGLHVVICEQKKAHLLPGKAASGDRSFALAYATTKVLERLGLWENLLPFVYPLKEIHISRANGGASLVFKANETGQPAFGFMVQESILRQSLMQALKKQSRLTLLSGVTARENHFTPSGLCVSVNEKKAFDTKLWVGADGTGSALRQDVHGATLARNYGQSALVFQIEHAESHHSKAFEHFTPYGPLAFLPLPNNCSAVVWSLDTVRAQELKGNSEALLHALIQHFGFGLGKLTLKSEIKIYALRLSMPIKTWGLRRLLIGDAAHTIHPVAGQGLNLGLRDAVCLAQHISEMAELGLDIGSQTSIDTYVKKREVDRWSMASFTHFLVERFKLPIRTFWDWDIGISLVKTLPFLKAQILEHAMGLGIDPALDAFCHADGR